MCNVRIYVTHEKYDVSCLKTMLHTKTCNVRTYVLHDCEICSVCLRLCYVQTYVTYEYEMCSYVKY